MAYIWINPVTENMYNPAALDAFLKQHRFKRVYASSHWLDTVKEKYKQALKTADHTVIDMRCPKIIHLIDAYDLRESVTIPNIEPILLHCAREISERKDLQGKEKIITTPCQVLADLGNSLGLKETLFLPWNKLIIATGGEIAASSLTESPIPPGFFDGLDCNMISVTGKENLCDLFEDPDFNQYDLIELLYCKDGCHNGDGVKMCK